jgi:hypothetical protein
MAFGLIWKKKGAVSYLPEHLPAEAGIFPLSPFERLDTSLLEGIRARADIFLSRSNYSFFNPRGLTAMVVSEPVREWLEFVTRNPTSSSSRSDTSTLSSVPTSGQVRQFADQLVAAVCSEGQSGGKGLLNGFDDKILAWSARLREHRVQRIERRSERWGGGFSGGPLRSRIRERQIDREHRRIDRRRRIEPVFIAIVPT